MFAVINFWELILTGSLEKSHKSQTLEPEIISCYTVYIHILLIINAQKPKIDQDNTIFTLMYMKLISRKGVKQ